MTTMKMILMKRLNRSRLIFVIICLIALHAFTTVSFAAPATPTGLWAYPSTSSQIYVAWDEVASATNYTLQWKQEPQASWNQIGGYPYDSYQHLDLKCNTTYSYRVAAVSISSGSSAFSSPVSATTLECPPGPPTPTNLTATAKSKTEIGLAWNDVLGETGYEMEYSSNGSSWSLLHTPNANQTSMNDVALQCGKIRYYRIRSVNANGKSNFSNTASATTFSCGPVKTELLYNGDFEINEDGVPALPDGWTAKGPMLGDKLVGKNFGDGYYVSTGKKAMLFQTFPLITNNDRLYQGIDISGIDFNEGDELELTASIRHVKGASDNKVIWVTVAYANGTKADIKVATFKQGGYFHHTNTLVLERSDVAAIAVRLGYNKPNGKLALDNLSLTLVQDASLSMENVTNRANGANLVPVPPAPADLRGSN